jgi:hypothetical protein
MRADSIKGVERPRNIKQSDDTLTNDIFSALAGRELTYLCDTLPIGHR